MVSGFIQEYLKELQACLDEIDKGQIEAIVNAITDCWRNDRQVLILGNGGSAATATHFASDLSKNMATGKNTRLKAISISDNMALITAIANDIGYASVFKEQLTGLMGGGDMVVCISASGNSPNVLEAARYAKDNGAKVIGLTGFGGGALREIADYSVVLTSTEYEQVEDIHMVLCHLIAKETKRRIAGGDMDKKV